MWCKLLLTPSKFKFCFLELSGMFLPQIFLTLGWKNLQMCNLEFDCTLLALTNASHVPLSATPFYPVVWSVCNPVQIHSYSNPGPVQELILSRMRPLTPLWRGPAHVAPVSEADARAWWAWGPGGQGGGCWCHSRTRQLGFGPRMQDRLCEIKLATQGLGSTEFCLPITSL